MKTLDQIVDESNGKILSVTFIKKDGTLRVMNGRLGVTKHLRGGASTLDASKYITLYDLQSEGYRAVNRKTIVSVTIGGIVHFQNQGA
jgi:hypothetical protein